ncbi:MAG: AhpC/TSA family protein [Bacteroidales bacterium]|jgi:thiol-disulfide isomerase/thioredoxin|nr:AhpC/TSA family protein [Bacteroidales bacterium]
MPGSLKNLIFATFIAMCIVSVSGCSSDRSRGIKTQIKGSFPSFKGKQVTLSEFDVNYAIPIDTVNISEDGSFRFRFYRSGPGFFLLKIDNKNYITLVLDREKHIEISTDLPSLRKNYTVKGSVDSELYRDFEMFLEVNRRKVDSLSRNYNDYQRTRTFRTIKMELDKSYQEIFNHQLEYTRSFLKNHCGSLSSLLVINRRFGERKIITEETDFSYFTLIDSCLSLTYPDNKYLAQHKKRIEVFREKLKIEELTEKRLAAGKIVPDIGLKDASGKTVSLHSFRGQPVILYFWASWDTASRAANKTLAELLEKKGKKGPSVYAVGLESHKDAWEDAIKADGLQKWTHVTDYMNIQSPTKSLFNVPGRLPYFVLIDKELVIRYRGNSFEDLSAEISRQQQ